MREKCTLRPKMETKYASETNLVLNKSKKISNRVEVSLELSERPNNVYL